MGREKQMISIRNGLGSVTDGDAWAARGASFVAKVKATKAVWFPPEPVETGKKAVSTAKKTTKKTAGTAKKTTSGAARKSAGAAKKATPKTAQKTARSATTRKKT